MRVLSAIVIAGITFLFASNKISKYFSTSPSVSKNGPIQSVDVKALNDQLQKIAETNEQLVEANKKLSEKVAAFENTNTLRQGVQKQSENESSPLTSEQKAIVKYSVLNSDGVLLSISRCGIGSVQRSRGLGCIITIDNVTENSQQICYGPKANVTTEMGVTNNYPYLNANGRTIFGGSPMCVKVPSKIKQTAHIWFSIHNNQIGNYLQYISIACGPGCNLEGRNVPVRSQTIK